MPSSVLETVWNWRDSSGRSTGKTEGASLRRQAVIQVIVMGAIGFVLYRWIGHETFAKVVWGLAAVILVLGLVAPRAYRPVHRFGLWLGKIIGALLTYVLLIPL